jgi:very-short-patch-repair endonuclease
MTDTNAELAQRLAGCQAANAELREMLTQSFFDAVRNDKDMSNADKAHWLQDEPAGRQSRQIGKKRTLARLGWQQDSCARKKFRVDHADQFAALWEWRGPTGFDLVREYLFARPRRWRFDFAHPCTMVAIEIEGGTWVNGRHTRGSGFEADCEKYNAAAILGWRVLRFTTTMLARDPIGCLTTVSKALGTSLLME